MARSAKQKAALRKAQLASARARRGRKRSRSSGHHYGTGKQGRRATRRATYGKKKHGLSIAQQQRRRQRANKWKRRGRSAMAAAGVAATIYAKSTPQQRSAAKGAAKVYGNRVKTKYKYHRSGMARQVKRGMR